MGKKHILHIIGYYCPLEGKVLFLSVYYFLFFVYFSSPEIAIPFCDLVCEINRSTKKNAPALSLGFRKMVHAGCFCGLHHYCVY